MENKFCDNCNNSMYIYLNNSIMSTNNNSNDKIE